MEARSSNLSVEFDLQLVEKQKDTSYSPKVQRIKLMTTYVFFDTALQMLVNSYLVSVILLLATSAIGIVVIETIEKTGYHSPKSKWFIQNRLVLTCVVLYLSNGSLTGECAIPVQAKGTP